MENVYSAPQADLSSEAVNETYEPKVFSLSGRIGRVRYIAFSVLATLIFYVFLIALIMIAGGGFASLMQGGAGTGFFVALGLGLLGVIPLMVFHFGLMRRRLNDLDQTGWLVLLAFVPLVNLAFTIYILVAPGSASSNKYGAAPSKNPTWAVVVAWIMPVFFILGIVAAIAIPAYMAKKQQVDFDQMQQMEQSLPQDSQDAAPAPDAAQDNMEQPVEGTQPADAAPAPAQQ